jgi:hypothetical protein
MERELAFDIGRNFLRERYHKPYTCRSNGIHQDNHSDAAINRVR